MEFKVKLKNDCTLDKYKSRYVQGLQAELWNRLLKKYFPSGGAINSEDCSYFGLVFQLGFEVIIHE